MAAAIGGCNVQRHRRAARGLENAARKVVAYSPQDLAGKSGVYVTFNQILPPDFEEKIKKNLL